MAERHAVYRSLVHLYPRAFRADYGDDLVQLFDDLAVDRGRRAAWARAGVDLVVTVPRYRLESIMSEQHSFTTLRVGILLLALGGLASVLLDFVPGLPLLVAALVLGVAQRSAIARAIRTPGGSSRRRRLTMAAVLAAVFAASIASYVVDLSDDHISGFSLLAHNAVGVPAMLAMIGFLVAGLLTPKAHATATAAPATPGI